MNEQPIIKIYPKWQFMNGSISDARPGKTALNPCSLLCKAGLFLAFWLSFTTIFAQTTTWYRDADGDGFGDSAVPNLTQLPGYVRNPLDCNDGLVNTPVWNVVGGGPVATQKASATKLAITTKGVPYILYREIPASGTPPLTVMGFNGSAWVRQGPGPVLNSDYLANIDVDSHGVPYIAFQEPDGSIDEATVMKYDTLSNTWNVVGAPQFANLSLGVPISITLDNNDVPYVIFTDDNGDVKVMKFNGANWVPVGGTLVSGTANECSITAGNNGHLYAAVVNSSNQTAIFTCDPAAPAWTQVGGGSAVFPYGGASELPLVALNSTNVPHVAYFNPSINNVEVQKYDGGVWSVVGAAPVYTAVMSNPMVSLAIDYQDAPVVALYDDSDAVLANRKFVLKRFDAVNGWVDAITGTTSSGLALSMAISPYTNAPYIAFADLKGGDFPTVSSVIPNVVQPVITSLTAGQSGVCAGGGTTLTVTGTLNDATQWQWFSGSCGGTPAGTGTSLAVSALMAQTTYYVRGSGACRSLNVTCKAITIGVYQAATWYRDNDNDGFGDAGTPSQVNCVKPTGYVINSSDCNDNSLNGVKWTYIDNAGGFSPMATAGPTVTAADATGVYVAFRDAAPAANRLTVMKYNDDDHNGSWEWSVLGTRGISTLSIDVTSAAVYNFSMSLDNAGVPYVAFRDGATAPVNKLTVMRFNGANWVAVGTNASTTAVESPSIAFDRNTNTPYVVFRDVSTAKQATVRKFDGTNWVDVIPLTTPATPAGFSAGNAVQTKIAIDVAGTPYVAYKDVLNSNRVTVMKYTDAGWVNVGSAGFAPAGSTADYVSLAIDNVGTPYVAYKEVTSTRINVMKYASGNWTAVGASNFSTGAADYISLALDNGGVPYVAFREGGAAGKAAVRRYDGTSWVAMGVMASTATVNDQVSMGLDDKGIPYVTFREANLALANKVSTVKMVPNPVAPVATTITSSAAPVLYLCPGISASATLTITTGTLNDASHWQWYSGACGTGTVLGTGNSIPITESTPGTDVTYFVRGEGTCVTTPALCAQLTIRTKLKPAITGIPLSPGTPLQDKIVCEDDVAVPAFAITATGDDLVYQWQKDGVDIPLATTSSLSLPSPMPTTAAATYKVIVTNVCDATGNVNDDAVLTVREKPRLTGTALADNTVCEDVTGTPALTVTTSGHGVAYKWQKDGVDISPAETTASLSLPSPMTTAAGATYRVIVTGTCDATGNVNDDAVLTVRAKPRLTGTALADNTVCEDVTGTPALTVTTSGHGVAYKWQKNGVDISPAETTASLSLPSPMTTAAGATYRVIVTGTCDATGNVNDDAVLTVREKPRLTGTALADNTVCEDVTGTPALTVTTSGHGVAYKWQKDGVDISPAETTASLSLPSPMTTAAGATYKVIITGTCDATGNLNDDALLTVHAKPSISVQPGDVTTCEGANGVTFSTTASGEGIGYQWQTNNGTSTWSNIPETNFEMEMNNVPASVNNYGYRVIVSGTCGTPVTSSSAVLRVGALASVALQVFQSSLITDLSNAVLCAGGDATFTGVVTGASGTLAYQWQQNTGSGWTDITGQTGATYVLHGITPAVTNYQYRVRAGNSGCAPGTSSAARISVNSFSGIMTQPVDVSACEAGAANFVVAANGINVHYQWQLSTPGGWQDIGGARNALFSLTPVGDVLNGNRYRVVVESEGCLPVMSVPAVLTVRDAPALETAPGDVTICQQGDALFTVTAGNDPGLQYHWEVNRGSDWNVLENQNSSLLALNSVSADMSGYRYRAVLTTPGCAPVVSGDALLTVNTIPGEEGCALFLQASEGLSPNGDNILDYWLIQGIELYPQNQVKIYNVWGDLIFEKSNYDNESNVWRGETTKGLAIGQQAPDGTYFYYLNLGNSTSPLRGFVVLKR